MKNRKEKESSVKSFLDNHLTWMISIKMEMMVLCDTLQPPKMAGKIRCPIINWYKKLYIFAGD